jgi:hypothetical protein
MFQFSQMGAEAEFARIITFSTFLVGNSPVHSFPLPTVECHELPAPGAPGKYATMRVRIRPDPEKKSTGTHDIVSAG